MPDLNFQVTGADVVCYAATPLLSFKVAVTNSPAEQAIHTVVLRAQIQIDATLRRYTRAEQEKLRDLFGEPERWSQTLRTMLWTHANGVVRSFHNKTEVELNVSCTFDFNVAATKYFHGLSDGDLPLTFLFSGTVFYADDGGALQVAPISWEKEARFKLPVAVWRDLMAMYYPNSAWLNIRKDVFDQLCQYKVQSGIPTWEQTLERLLAGVEETARP